MPAGKSRHYPTPGTHTKCRTCEVSLICISGRRRFGQRFWCAKCRGVYYRDLDMVIRCVVFRNKRGRYLRQDCCPACTGEWVLGDPPYDHNNLKIHDRKKEGHGRIVEGITHRDAQAWKTNSCELADTEPHDVLSINSSNRTRNP